MADLRKSNRYPGKTKSDSLRHQMIKYWVLMSGIMIVTFILYGIYDIHRYRADFVKSDQYVAENYTGRLNQEIQASESYIKTICASDMHFQTLLQKNISEADEIKASYYLANVLENKAGSMDYFGGFFFYNQERNSMRSIYSDGEYERDSYGLNKTLKDCLAAKTSLREEYEILEYSGQKYLCYSFGIRKLYTGFLINLEEYVKHLEIAGDGKLQIVCRMEDQVLFDVGSSLIDTEELNGELETVVKRTKPLSHILVSGKRSGEKIEILMIRSAWNSLMLWKNPAVYFIFLILPGIMILLFLRLYRNVNQIMLLPMEHLLERIEGMRQNGEEENQKEKKGEEKESSQEKKEKEEKQKKNKAEEKETGLLQEKEKENGEKNRIKREEWKEKKEQKKADKGKKVQKYQEGEEFQQIHSQLDEMLDEMERLSKEKYEQELEANAARLQYLQLQINPHFFLNCLNLLDSLVTDHKEETVIKGFIYALSRHFRYIFRDQAKEVTVKEEMEEVEAYCKICMIRTGNPIFLQKSMEKGVEERQIPILCIQTFVENSVKYGRKEGRILSLKVMAERFQDEGTAYLRIRIKDNGEGYSAEKLGALNRPADKFQYHSENVGIDNVKYRLHLMYGAGAKVIFYNDNSGGAVTELLIPDR